SEIRDLGDAVQALFRALTPFNVDHTMWFMEYDPRIQRPRGSDHRSDVEWLLDTVAQNSLVLNMPEYDPQKWPYRRAQLSSTQLATLNEYRRKFNKPEV